MRKGRRERRERREVIRSDKKRRTTRWQSMNAVEERHRVEIEGYCYADKGPVEGLIGGNSNGSYHYRPFIVTGNRQTCGT